jgi:hypothetical protein
VSFDFSNNNESNSNSPTATFITPNHYGPVTGDTIEDALRELETAGDAVVKLNGSEVDINAPIQAGAVYIVVPGTVAKGGFPGA